MVTIENQYFSIPQICMSGQCFRLDPVPGDTYELIASDRYLRIKVEEGAPSGAADGVEGRKGGTENGDSGRKTV